MLVRGAAACLVACGILGMGVRVGSFVLVPVPASHARGLLHRCRPRASPWGCGALATPLGCSERSGVALRMVSGDPDDELLGGDDDDGEVYPLASEPDDEEEDEEIEEEDATPIVKEEPQPEAALPVKDKEPMAALLKSEASRARRKGQTGPYDPNMDPEMPDGCRGHLMIIHTGSEEDKKTAAKLKGPCQELYGDRLVVIESAIEDKDIANRVFEVWMETFDLVQYHSRQEDFYDMTDERIEEVIEDIGTWISDDGILYPMSYSSI